MSRYVVDASVVAKWFIPEDHSEIALRLLNGNELLAPDLLYAEFGNILWKKRRRGELHVEQLLKAVAGLCAVPIRVEASSSIVVSAIEIACDLDRSVYDSLYLALAVAQNCELVTADRRLYNSLRGTVLHSRIVWVEAIAGEASH